MSFLKPKKNRLLKLNGMPDELKRGEKRAIRIRKNQYNAFIVLLAQYACNNDLKQVFLACSRQRSRVCNGNNS